MPTSENDELNFLRYSLGYACGDLANEMTQDQFSELERSINDLERLGRKVSTIECIVRNNKTSYLLVTHGKAEEFALSTHANGPNRGRNGKSHLDLENDKYASRINFEIATDEQSGKITPATLLATYQDAIEFFDDYNFHLEKFT